jgi:phosphatidylinositol alpha 1,6-mannosyltransferase
LKEIGELAAAPESYGIRGRPPGALRVALITNGYGYIEDGIALTVTRLVDYLAAQGISAMVFAPVAKRIAFGQQDSLVSTPSMPLPLRPEYRFVFGLSRRARERLDLFRPDIVHITVPDLLGLQALLHARKTGTPVVASYHTRYETYLRFYRLGFLVRPLQRYLDFFYRSCREVYVPSESMMETLQAVGEGKTLRLWRRGVDTDRFSPGRRSMSWRRAHGIADDEIVVAFVSRLVREKGLAILAETLLSLSRRGIRVRSVIVGDGPERGVLQAKLADSIFTGFLRGSELATAYASADIFLFPSDTETFGSVTLEAMASGVPAVCADATGSRSLVVDAVTGYLAPAADAEAFARHVAMLAQSAELRQRVGGAARLRSLDFSWDAEMARLVGYYRSLLTDCSR